MAARVDEHQAVDMNRGDVSCVNQPANPAAKIVDARSGRKPGGAPLSLYQARAAALRLRDLQLRNEAGRRR